MILHSKDHFLLGIKYDKCDIVSYSRIFNIASSGIALKPLHFKIRKNGYNFNLIVLIALNTVIGNQSYWRLASQTKKMLGKVYFYQGRLRKTEREENTQKNPKPHSADSLNVS